MVRLLTEQQVNGQLLTRLPSPSWLFSAPKTERVRDLIWRERSFRYSKSSMINARQMMLKTHQTRTRISALYAWTRLSHTPFCRVVTDVCANMMESRWWCANNLVRYAARKRLTLSKFIRISCFTTLHGVHFYHALTYIVFSLDMSELFLHVIGLSQWLKGSKSLPYM